ncbi:MAG: tetratricopeptide repeat protein [Cyanobacteriota bacterium]|nr:tetratricopeptide repeat protein [Cyanobacteriota bacterium]
MTPTPENSLTQNDRTELENLVNVLELSDGTTIVFAVAPDSSPKHPVVGELRALLGECEEEFAVQNFFYSDESLHPFLSGLKPLLEGTRRVVMAFGIDRLPLPRQVRELRQLNLGREMLFSRNLVLVFWLNRREYLEVFRDRAPDFWDWREQVVTFETRPRLEPLLYPYLEWLIAENSALKMGGVMQVQRQVDLFLDRVYVSLRGERQVEVASRSKGEMESAARRSPGKSLGKSLGKSFADELEPIIPDFVPDFGSPDLGSSKTVTEKVDLAQAVRNQQYSVILGDPGAGKTTLLRYLALHFATARRDEEETVLAGEDGEDLGQTRLPIFFRIADYAEKLATQPDLKLDEFLQQFYRQWETQLTAASTEISVEEVAQLLCEKLQSGQCIVLLDGLDEVFDRSSRKQIVDRIEAFVSAYAGNKFVITSRIAGYREVNLSARFGHFTITEMESEQVERFLRRWCLAVEQAQQPDATPERQERNAEEEVRGLLGAIDSNEGVKRLTGNPLLLTILALIHRNGSRLPHRRVELYALAVKTLTEDWQLGKKLPDGEKVLLKETEVVDLLAPLAYWMHEEKPSGLVSQEEVEAKLAEKLAELNDEEPDSPSVRQAVEAFLRRVRETTGLFVERAPGFYGFMHLTFEEYFAARYIADNDSGEMLALIRRHWEDARWEEPILLALGYCGRSSPLKASQVVENLFDYLLVLKTNFNSKKYCYFINIVFRFQNHLNLFSKKTNILKITPIKNIFNLISTILESNRSKTRKFIIFAIKILNELEINGKIYSDLVNVISFFSCLLLVSDEFKENSAAKINKRILSIEDFSNLLQELKCDRLIKEISKELKKYFYDISLPKFIRLKAVEIYCFLYFSNNKSNKLEFSQKLISPKELAFAYFKAGFALQKQNQYQESIIYYKKSCELYSQENQKIDVAFEYRCMSKCYQKLKQYELSLEFQEDSLKIYKELNLQEDIALSELNTGLIYHYWKKYDRAILYYNSSLEKFNKLNITLEISSLYYNHAQCYIDWKKYQDALKYSLKYLEINQQLDCKVNVASAYYQLGKICRNLEQDEESINYQKQCVETHQQLDDQFNIALAHFRLGQLYEHFKKYEEAILSYHHSLQICQELEPKSDEAILWSCLAKCHRELKQYQQALECEQQNLEIHKSLNNRSKVALSYYQFGEIYRFWGKYQEAINYYTNSRHLCQTLNQQHEVANLWANIALCYQLQNKYKESIECQQQCIKIFQNLEDRINLATSYFRLGSIYQNWKKYEEAIYSYQQSLQLFQNLSLKFNIASSLYRLFECYRNADKYEEAIECQQQCIEICKHLDNKQNLAIAYCELGKLYQNCKKYEEAIDCYQESCDIYQELGQQEDLANQYYSLSDCYQKIKQYRDALEYGFKYLEICQQLDDKPKIASAYFNIGTVYLLWRKFDKAIEFQFKDLEIRQQLDDRQGIAFTYSYIGLAYTGLKKYEKAIEYFKNSKTIYKELDRQKEIADLWLMMGDCYHQRQKYHKGVECKIQELKIRKQLDDQTKIASAYYQLGKIYQDWKKYEEAIEYFQQSRELYQQLEKEEDVANQLSWLASCYRDLEDYPKAIEYFQQSCDLYQKLEHNESTARRYRQIGNTQRLMAKNTLNSSLLTEAEQNIQHAIQLDTAGEYRESLAYDAIVLALICAEFLHHLPANSPEYPERIAQFEANYRQGFDSLTQLGKTVSRAEEALDIARAYLEVPALHNPDTALTLAREALQTFQDFNRRKLQAKALKLLGEIHRHRGEEETARTYFSDSANLYRELDLPAKVAEVEEFAKL